MTCAMCETLIDPLVDGELPSDEAAEARAHIGGCAACAARMDRRLALSDRLKAIPRYAAPDVLRARINGIGAAPVAPGVAVKRHTVRNLSRAVLAAAAVVAVLFTGRVVIDRARGDAIPQQLLASHLRSLLPGRLIDVQSTDRHNVKPWFNGRLAISPDVPDLDSAGYTLVGGRVDYVGTTPAAVVVYRRRQHVISVFSWPAAEGAASSAIAARNGFQLIHLPGDGVDRWIVSDLNRAELEDFSRRFGGSR